SLDVTFAQDSGTGSVDGLGTEAASSGVATETVTGGSPGTVALSASATGASAGTTVSFTVVPKKFTLTVSRLSASTGTGTITNEGASLIDCGATCSHGYDDGTTVTLTANADPGSTFDGWGGACTGTSTCDVTMDAAKDVTALFSDSNTTAATVQDVSSNGSASAGTSTDSVESGVTTPNAGTVAI